jgi:Dolichyl-phosphate-mannose-protein mannosyltransferase
MPHSTTHEPNTGRSNVVHDLTMKAEIILISALICVGAFLRFLKLDFQSLWRDELGSVQPALAAHSVWELARHTPPGDTHPPFSHLFLRLWSDLFGTSTFALRSSSAVWGTLGLVVIYFLSRQLFARSVQHLTLVCLTAFSLFLIYYSQEIRSYIYVATLVICAAERFVAWYKNPHWFNSLAYSLVTAIVFYTFYLGIFAVVGHGVYMLLEFIRGRIPWQRVMPTSRSSVRTIHKTWVGAHILSFLYVSPWLFELTRQASDITQEFWTAKPTAHLTYHTLLMFLGWEMPPWGFYPPRRAAIQLAAVILTVALLFISYIGRHLPIWSAVEVHEDAGANQLEHSPDPFMFSLTWVVVGFSLPWLISYYSSLHIFMPRTVIYVVPGVLLFCTCVISRIPFVPLRNISVALLLAPGIGNMPWYYSHYHKEQWRDLVPYVEERAHVDDVLFAKQPARGFEYYGRKQLDELSHRDIGVAQRVWVIRQTVGSDQDASDTQQSLQAAGYHMSDGREFAEIAATLWVK